MRRLLAIATVVVLAFSLGASATHWFSDVPHGHTHANGIEWVAENGLMVGSQGTFAPEDNLTRAQFATVLLRYHKWAATSTTTTTSVPGSTQPSTTQPSTTSTAPSTTTTPPATTTTAPSTTTTEPPQAENSIGVIGCSNVRQAVEGYRAASGLDLLAPTAQNAGVIRRWANENSWWVLYDQLRPAGGYTAAWVVLCEHSPTNQGPGLLQSNLVAIRDKIYDRDPGIPIILSPLNLFHQGNDCNLTNGNEIPLAGDEMVDDIVAIDSNASRGPWVGVPNGLQDNELVSDDCHLNPAGIARAGDQLVDFFD